jgi:hypothetical protein
MSIRIPLPMANVPMRPAHAGQVAVFTESRRSKTVPVSLRAFILLGGLLAVLSPWASQAAAQLARRTLEIDLGSGIVPGPLPFDEPFYLSSKAPETLLEVRMWNGRETVLSRESCAQRPPSTDTIAVHFSRWSRAKLDSLQNFVLDASPLAPNTDYTFCFHLIRRPSPQDSVAFMAAAIRRLGAVVRKLVPGGFETFAVVDSLQDALIKAIPRADSVEILDSTSILLARRNNETNAQRRARLNRITDVIAPMRSAFMNQKSGLSGATSTLVEATQSLQALAGNATLRRLQVTADSLGASDQERTRLATAGLLASRLARFSDAESDRVAAGIHPLDGPVEVADAPDLEKATAETVLREMQNTQRTRTLLRDIRDLGGLLRERPQLLVLAGLDQNSLDALDALLDAGMTALGARLAHLEMAAGAQAEITKRVQELANSVTSIDFAKIALRSTTSLTYTARANTYFSLDAGLLGAYQVGRAVPYFGVNVYLRPVNKNAPLSLCKEDCFRRRFALTFGVTASSIKEEGRVDDLFSGHSILLGAGVRLNDYLRLTVGALLLRSYGSEPERKLHVNARPALSTSLDIDIVGTMGKVAGALFNL